MKIDQLLPLLRRIAAGVHRNYRSVPVDDLVQEGAIALLSEFSGYVPKAATIEEDRYLRTAIRYRMIDAARRAVGRGRHILLPLESGGEDEGSILDMLSDPASPVDEVLTRVEGDASLAQAVERLPVPLRDMIRLRYWEGMTLAQIGKSRKIPPAMVTQRHAFALRLVLRCIRCPNYGISHECCLIRKR
jgi:RNA polymerase sigma factor (sigma-70 family)